jgi:cbb3-type cytochrome c oxidase subunit III
MSFRRVFALTAPAWIVPALIGLVALGSAQAQTPDAPPAPESTEAAATPAPTEAGEPSTPAVSAPTSADTAAPAAETTAPASSATAAANAEPIVYGDAEAGAAKAAVCAACHGADGNSTDKQYPKIAGQNEAYIARQLALFKSGERMNPIMMGFASPLSPQDMHDIGAYFATKSALPGVADEQFVERGEALYRGGDADLGVPACMACHGPDGRGMAGAGYPQLAGQWSEYVSMTLKAWKDGTTWGSDAHAQIMPAIVKPLSEADIAALSSYVGGLHTAEAGTTTAGR